MKKIKRVLSVILAIIILTACNTTIIFAENNKIEISFSVGDSILSINGNKVEVETPYVVKGTTLVPLRVISEAFGAEVNWDGDKKTITILYSGVAIELTIDSCYAYINGNETDLTVAPELTNGTTMLPMRFITESLGADVSYDETTKAITVVKEKTQSNSIIDYSMILKSSTKNYVGDSYYGWSVERSPRYKLVNRSFDGRENWFEIESIGAVFDVLIYDKQEKTIDEIYNTYKDQSKYVTTNKLDKGKTSTEYQYVNFQCKSADDFCDYRTYIYNDYIVDVILKVDVNTNRSEFLELADLSATFDFKFDKSISEDLSDVDINGMHVYKSKSMGVKINIPASFIVFESENQTNSICFVDYHNSKNFEDASFISLDMYSSYEGHTYETWAKEDRNHNKNFLNPSLSNFSEIQNINIGSKSGVYYTYDINNNNNYLKSTKDVFISSGNYFYNISVSAVTKRYSQLAEKVFNSISFDTLNDDEIGIIIKTEDDEKITFNNKSLNDMSIGIPSNWETTLDRNGLYSFSNNYAIILSCNETTLSGTAGLSDLADSYVTYLNKDKNVFNVGKPSIMKVANKSVYLVMSNEKLIDMNITRSTYSYIILYNDCLFLLTISSKDICNGKEFSTLRDEILHTISFK